jgi:dolichol-phosphate mannosyltransferase
MLISIVSPAHNEEKNLPLMHQHLTEALGGLDWEWVVVDDHSTDGTFAVLTALSAKDTRIRAVRFSRNFGSHKAILCGLHESSGDCVAVIASDLQTPPSLIPQLVEQWRSGHHVVWAERAARSDTSGSGSGLAFIQLYYWLMRRVIGLTNMPPQGADVFLLDRRVVDTMDQFNEQHVSLVALLSWVGFKQTTISYQRQERVHGASSWTLAKKIRLVIDSIVGFSYLPIRAIAAVGLGLALLGFVYALVVIGLAIGGSPPAGWSSLMVAVLVIGGVQMVTMGILGEYIWRSLDQSRQRPPYVIEDRSPLPAPRNGGSDDR